MARFALLLPLFIGFAAVGLNICHRTGMHHKIAVVLAAARTFVRSSNPEDDMFVLNFNERVTSGLPAAMRSAQYDIVAAGLAGGGRRLSRSLTRTQTEVCASCRRQPVEAFHILLERFDAGDPDSNPKDEGEK